MLQRVYGWTMSLAAHQRADWALAFVSFLESSVFPVPPDVLLMPMVLARREKAWYYAGLCTVASVLGAAAGYALGLFAFETIGRPLLEAYGYMDAFTRVQTWFNDWGAWIVLTAGITPVPYKVFTIASGVTQLNFGVFIVASLLARSFRFYLVAALLWKFGPPIRDFIEKRLALVVTVFVLLVFGGYIVIEHFIGV